MFLQKASSTWVVRLQLADAPVSTRGQPAGEKRSQVQKGPWKRERPQAFQPGRLRPARLRDAGMPTAQLRPKRSWHCLPVTSSLRKTRPRGMCRGAATKSNWGAISECCPPGRAHVLLEAVLTFLVDAGNGESAGPAVSETARCLTPGLSGPRSPGKQGSCPIFQTRGLRLGVGGGRWSPEHVSPQASQKLPAYLPGEVPSSAPCHYCSVNTSQQDLIAF